MPRGCGRASLSGEQFVADGREFDEGSVLVQLKQAARDRQLEASLVSAGLAWSPNRNGPLIVSM
jgi:hypothetical protein